jgi:hypothetical protein
MLVEVLKGHPILDGNKAAADFIASKSELIEVPEGQSIITQGGEDNDIYFVGTQLQGPQCAFQAPNQKLRSPVVT